MSVFGKVEYQTLLFCHNINEPLHLHFNYNIIITGKHILFNERMNDFEVLNSSKIVLKISLVRFAPFRADISKLSC